MSPTVRAGVVFGLATVGAVAGATLLPIPCLSFLAVVALGLGAGYTAAKNSNATRDQRVGRGATAGAIAGGIALVGTAIAIPIITMLLPSYQEQIQAGVNQALQQNPELADSGLDPSSLATLVAGAGGVIGGVCGGMINFIVMLLTGLLGALFWKGAPAGAGYVPAGNMGYGPPSGSYIPSQTNDPSYGTPPNTQAGGMPYGGQDHGTPPSQESGARIYDPNDRDRSQ